MDDDATETKPGGLDAIVEQFDTYEDYLDNQVTPVDMYYLEDEEMARQLVELGYRGDGEILRREEFDARKEAAFIAAQQRANKKPKKLASAGKNFDGKPLLKALAQREEAVRNGKLTTIVFIRDKNAKGQEVSGYLDYAHRLKTTDFEAVFDGKKSLLPKPGDLSFYNWETQTSTSHSTPNFQVISDDERGLMFKNKRDRKVIDVDPASRPGDNSARFDVVTDEYRQVVLYDHISRRRT